MSTATISSPVEDLRKVIGGEAVMDDAAKLAIWCEDIASTVEPCVAVAFPGSTEDVQAIIRIAREHDLKIVPRGAGLSYTGGYLPSDPMSIMIDMSRMDKVVEFNAEDMYITLEAGCTWAKVRETLAGSGLNSAYWGPLSGLRATVGGAASQNSIFFGAAKHGTASESILGLEVVLADGSVVKTGAGANREGVPFFRHYGPNLAGIFIGDTGAMGVKTKVTLQLVRSAPVKRFASYAFAERAPCVEALSIIGRSGQAIECFSFDPVLQVQRLKRESLAKDIKVLAGVMKSSGGFLKGIGEGAKLVIAGRSFAEEDTWSVHVTVEGETNQAVDKKLADIKATVTRLGGAEIENTIPKAVHASPFNPPNSMIGPEGERWIVTHGIVPHSRTAEAFAKIDALVAENAEGIAKYKVEMAYFTICVGPSAINIEPIFYWPDQLKPMHLKNVEDSLLKRVNKFPAVPGAEEFVYGLRSQIKSMFRGMGGTHFQIGKAYPLKPGMDEQSWAMLQAVKSVLDPEGRINPGSLGL